MATYKVHISRLTMPNSTIFHISFHNKSRKSVVMHYDFNPIKESYGARDFQIKNGYPIKGHVGPTDHAWGIQMTFESANAQDRSYYLKAKNLPLLTLDGTTIYMSFDGVTGRLTDDQHVNFNESGNFKVTKDTTTYNEISNGNYRLYLDAKVGAYEDTRTICIQLEDV